jgi:hypothetical protein
VIRAGTFFLGSRVPRNATHVWSPRPSRPAKERTSSGVGRRKSSKSTPWWATVIRPDAAPAYRTSSSAVARLGTMHRAARRRESRVHDRKNLPLKPRCSSRSEKKVASCRVTTVGFPVASGIV